MSGEGIKNFDSGSGSAGIGTSGRKKNVKFVNLWIDFREDIFPVYFYSESESYSLKSIQRITNSLAFSCQKFRYRHCRNRNRNSWFLLCSPPISTTTSQTRPTTSSTRSTTRSTNSCTVTNQTGSSQATTSPTRSMTKPTRQTTSSPAKLCQQPAQPE